MAIKITRITAVTLSVYLTSCTSYYSNRQNGTIHFASVGTNFGILTNEDRGGDSNSGFTSGGSSVLGVRSTVAQTESSTAPSIAFADGTVITGTIDQVSGVNSIGTTISRVTFIRAWRDVFKRMFDSIDSGVDATVENRRIDAGVEKADIAAGVRETEILNPVEPEIIPVVP